MSEAAPTAWLVGLEAQQRTFDVGTTFGTRPHGEPGLRLSIDGHVSPQWTLAVSAHFGGAWSEWSDPDYGLTRRVEGAAWSARLGADRVFKIGEGKGFVGLGAEYGEARSWVTEHGWLNWTYEEPTSYMTGGYIRLGAMTPLWHRLAFSAQISQSFYHARASDPPYATSYAWLGRSFAMSAGIRFAITRGTLGT